MEDVFLETVSIITSMMEEFNIIEIRLDKLSKIVYVSYLDENLDQKMKEIKLDTLTSTFNDSVDFTEPGEYLSDYDDPDLWQDGQKPYFEVR